MNEEKTIYPYQILDIEDLEGEEWKDIAGYEGLYAVSNMGRIKGLDRTVIKKNGNKNPIKGRIKKQKFQNSGYLRVMLSKENKDKYFLVHRLVAQAFLEDYSDDLTVNHKSEFEKQLNTVDNLEMMTLKDNINYGTHNLRVRKAISKTVGKFSLDGTLLTIYPSTKECGRQGFNQSAVWQCCYNKFNREGNNIYKGFIWQYI